MSISTRAYKVICKRYGKVLARPRLTRAYLEAGLGAAAHRRPAPAPVYGLETLDPRILLSGIRLGAILGALEESQR